MSTPSLTDSLPEPSVWSFKSLGWSLLFFLSILTFSCYIASVPFIQKEWALSNIETSLLFSMYLVGYAVSSVICVPLSDRYAPGAVFLTGLCAMCVPNLLFPFIAVDMWSGSILRFIAGAGQVVSYTSGMQLIARRHVVRRGTAVSIFVGAAYSGTTVSYVLMGLLLQSLEDWRSAYLIVSGVSSLSLILAFPFLKGQDTPATPGATNRKAGRLDLTLIRDVSIMRVIAAYAIHTADLYVVRLWMPLLLGATLMYQGMTSTEAAAQASTLSGLMFMVGGFSVLVGGWWSDQWGRRNTAIFILLLTALCSGGIGWLVSVPTVYVIIIGFMIGFLTASDSAIYSTSLIELAPEGKIGAVQALQAFLGFTVGAIMPIVAGSLIDMTDSILKWGVAFSFNALLSVIGIFCLLGMKRSLTAKGAK